MTHHQGAHVCAGEGEVVKRLSSPRKEPAEQVSSLAFPLSPLWPTGVDLLVGPELPAVAVQRAAAEVPVPRPLLGGQLGRGLGGGAVVCVYVCVLCVRVRVRVRVCVIDACV
jgi:hypothetical protein